MRLHRRAEFALPLHWLLVLVGGGLFLLLFFLFAHSALKSADQTRLRDLSYRLETEFAFAAAENDLFKELEVPKDEFEIVCTQDTAGEVSDAYLRISSSSYTPDALKYIPIFSSDNLRGPTLSVWSRSWHAPMTVGTLLLADDRFTRYVFVADEPWTRNLAMKLDQYRVTLIVPGDLSSFEPTGDERYRFILFSGNLADIKEKFRDKSSALLVSSLDQGRSGGITFYDDIAGTVPSYKTEYYGETMLFAAVFTTSSGYRCNMAKATRLLEVSIDVLQEKARILGAEATAGAIPAECGEYYGRAESILTYYRKQGILALRRDAPLIADIQRTNTALRNKECPPLY